ncbi:aminoglycoside phosphotransferase family protein [Bacillus sp. RG28]|uniref:Aminoglycoside phosphotransferase family protein n=1 Tax=Gottfriedia endophytica TaxID=2820819 RepID=A0A940SIS2_9BACI|nr:aminoglycoside phosphotransferase family protein [Gottfriedia endophytica]MBP0725285.1 aminoglycoside phosphotransferase family protein [Gottfriedia endophytica]
MVKKNVQSDILKKYKIEESAFLGKGMEAEVYLYENDKVLKIYNPKATLTKLQLLKQFYESIKPHGISFKLPHIEQIIEESGRIITIEKRIEGKNIQKALSQYDDERLNAFLKNYLSVILQIQSIQFDPKFEGYKLLNDYDLPPSQQKDWNYFLKQYLINKQDEVKDYLSKDVLNYQNKFDRLIRILSSEYTGDNFLIHGDFYPGNLLVSEDGKINGVIDFGLMTMYGDYLFDVALSWVLFDMYDKLGDNVLNRYLDLIITALGEETRSTLYLYVLFYSIYSANFFSETCSDGHYNWSVRQLNNETFWKGLE